MHGSTLTRPQRGTRAARTCRTRALENRLTWNWTPRRGTVRNRTISDRLPGLNRRGLVHRTRTRLRNDHARSWRLRARGRTRRRCSSGTLRLNRSSDWSARNSGRGGIHLRRRRNRTGWSRTWRNRRRACRRSLWRRNRSYRRCDWGTRGRHCRRSNNSGRDRSWRRNCRSRRLRSHRCGRLGFLHRRCSGLRRRSRCGRGSGLLLVKNGLQHVSGLGDMRQVNLGFDFVGAGIRSARRLCRAVPVPRAFEVCTNFFGFVVFERTGMRLLLGDANFRQHIENGFAFDFQFPG